MWLIDKPAQLTSHDVVARVRKLTGVKRVGHAGTLDPLATGLLIVLVGREETKQQYKFLILPKIYEVAITFGATSSTDDAEGELTRVADPSKITRADISSAGKKFIGTIQQRPPVFSAVHYHGKRAYRLARQNAITITDLPERSVTISQIEILDWTKPVVRLRVACSHGTYIRSLARDIGAALQVGGYVSVLRRIQIGSYNVAEAISLAQLTLNQTTPIPLK
ncbi:MAG: tRNA pseudouridine synthase B [uncultured bacterium]|nr:MAG: tRNA pseudouridine synthase B [uncultured bacterium]